MRLARISVVVSACALSSACPPESTRKVIPTQVVTIGELTRTILAEGNLRAVHATPITSPIVPGRPGKMRLAWLAPDGARVEKGEIVLRFDPTDFQKNLQESKAARASASAELEKEQVAARRTKKERNTDLRLAELTLEKLKRFRKQDKEIYARHQIVEAEVDESLSRAQHEHAEAAKKLDRKLSSSKLDLARAQRQRADLEMKRASENLTFLDVRAPHDGLFVLHRDWRGETPRVGEIVWFGSPLAEIPDLGEMEAEIFILEVDGRGLAVGIPVTIIVESMPERTFAGKISRIDDLARPRVRGVPVQYFAATVELEVPHPAAMKPGQRVRARLELQSPPGVIIPRYSVFGMGKDEVVFVQKGTDWEARKVELGEISLGRVMVTTGLEIGQVIALTDPR